MDRFKVFFYRVEVNISSRMEMNKFESNRSIFCIREAYTPQLRQPTDWYAWVELAWTGRPLRVACLH